MEVLEIFDMIVSLRSVSQELRLTPSTWQFLNQCHDHCYQYAFHCRNSQWKYQFGISNGVESCIEWLCIIPVLTALPNLNKIIQGAPHVWGGHPYIDDKMCAEFGLKDQQWEKSLFCITFPQRRNITVVPITVLVYGNISLFPYKSLQILTS